MIAILSWSLLVFDFILEEITSTQLFISLYKHILDTFPQKYDNLIHIPKFLIKFILRGNIIYLRLFF